MPMRAARRLLLRFAWLVTGLGAVSVVQAQTSCQFDVLSSITINSGNGDALTNNGSISIGPSDSAACSLDGTGAILSAGGAAINFNFSNQGTNPVLVNNGTIAVNDGGQMQWTAFSGTVVVEDNGHINLGQGGSGATLTLFDSATFDLTGTGTLTMSASGNDRIIGGSQSETLINDSFHTVQGSGTISGVTFTNNGYLSATGASLTINPNFEHSIVNNGEISVTGPGGLTVNFTSYVPSIPAVQNNNLVSDSTRIVINGGGYINGALANTTLNGNASLSVSGQFTNQAGGALTLVGFGNLVSVGVLQNSGLIAVGPNSLLLAGSWADLDALGNLNDAGNYNLNGGQFAYSGGDVLNLTSGVNLGLAADAGGPFVQDANGSTVLLSHDGGVTSALDNLNSISAGASFTLSGIVQNLNGGLNNAGTLALNNNASMTVDTLNVTNGSGGAINITGGSKFTVGAPGFDAFLVNSGLITASSGGILNLGMTGFTSTITNTTTIVLSGGSLTLDSGGNGNLATLNGAGAINLVNGTILGVSGAETLYNANNTIAGYGAISNLSLQNAGTIVATGGPLLGGVAGGVLTITTSPLALIPDTNLSTGLMMVNAGAAMAWQANNPSGTAFINNGTVTVNDGGQLEWVAGAGAGSTISIQNNGKISVGQGGSGAALVLWGAGSPVTFDLGGTGTLTLSGSGNDQITGVTGLETLLNDVGHTIKGSGTISNVAVLNMGTISADVGSLTTLGSLTNSSHGVLNVVATLNANAGLTNGGQVNMYGVDSTLNASTVDNFGQMNVEIINNSGLPGVANANVFTSGAFTNETGGTVNIIDVGVGSASSVTISGKLTNAGNIVLESGGTLTANGGLTTVSQGALVKLAELRP
jgi:fibronectin-binding autotransporter adhesin